MFVRHLPGGIAVMTLPASEPAGAERPSSRFSANLTLRGKQNLTAYIFLAIPMCFFLGIRIAPTIYAFAMSFFKNVGTGLTLSNYHDVLTSTTFWRAVLNTLMYVVITVPCQMALGVIIALMIGRIRKLKGFYRTVYFLPYITSAVAISWVWRLMYDPSMGLLNAFFGWFHLPAQSWLQNPTEALVSVSIVMIWQNVGFAMLIFMAGLEAIPRMLYEAARVDGASSWQVFWRITWPLLNPTLVFLAVTGVISALQTFTQIANLTGGSGGEAGGPLNSTVSIVLYVYNVGFSDFNLPLASAVTVFLFLLILLVTMIQLKVLNREYEY
jgi:multiple sugar transport system permease protein